MLFTKKLHEGIKNGDITTSIRIWKSARVKVGKCYKLSPGEIEVTHLQEISFDDINDSMARDSGFANKLDLLKTAKHGAGQRVYFVRFVYHSS